MITKAVVSSFPRSLVSPCLLIAFSILAVASASASAAPDKEAALKASLKATFVTMPLSFTENQGQWPDSILYRATAGGATMWFTPTGAYYQFTRRIPNADDTLGIVGGRRPRLPLVGIDDNQLDSVEITMVKAEFVGSNLNASAMGLSEMEYKCNYFIGNEPDKWRTDVPNYESIQYQEVYPGIDLKYYGNGKQMEYDFIVSPGADYSQIQIRYDGAENLTIGENGELIIKMAHGEIIEQPPIVYQTVNGHKVNLEGQYLVSEDNTFSFRVDSRYNPEHELVIDPVLDYSTYLGASSHDAINAITLDSEGAAYMIGYTFSADFPTLDPLQGISGGVYDAFIAKLNSSGNSLVYSTYLGGDSRDIGTSIAADASGAAYMTGYTESINFPTFNPYQGTYQGGPPFGGDVFVTKLNSAGNTLVYSTYLGGEGGESGDIVVDAADEAYVAGRTSSTNFPTLNPYQSTYQGGAFDAFVTKLNSAGDGLVFSTYLGGSGDDRGSGISMDAAGAAHVTGLTSSTNFPTINPYQGTHQGGTNDVFVTKLSNSGNSLDFSTYLGGSGDDYGYDIAVDAAGAAYVTGHTGSSNFPTLNPYQGTHQGVNDAFVTKLDLSQSGVASLVYSTYLGGSANELSTGIAVNAAGAAYVSGLTSSTDFPTLNSYQGTYQGGDFDVFVAKLSSIGSSLFYSTYLGGSGSENGLDIFVDASGATYVTGWSDSPNFPTTLDPYQETFLGGFFDGFVTKLSNDSDDDSFPDDVDNCPTIANSGQEDWNNDGTGDACNPTPTGSNVVVQIGATTTITFTGVTTSGTTGIVPLGSGPTPPANFAVVPVNNPLYYQISTTATFTPPIEVCFTYSDANLIGNEADLTLMHHEGGVWVDIKSSQDLTNNVICGMTNSLSFFALMEQCCIGIRGDVNSDGADADILDLNYLVNRIFRGGPKPRCPKEADVNSNGMSADIVDLNFLVNRIFRIGPPPGPC